MRPLNAFVVPLMAACFGVGGASGCFGEVESSKGSRHCVAADAPRDAGWALFSRWRRKKDQLQAGLPRKRVDGREDSVTSPRASSQSLSLASTPTHKWAASPSSVSVLERSASPGDVADVADETSRGRDEPACRNEPTDAAASAAAAAGAEGEVTTIWGLMVDLFYGEQAESEGTNAGPYRQGGEGGALSKMSKDIDSCSSGAETIGHS